MISSFSYQDFILLEKKRLLVQPVFHTVKTALISIQIIYFYKEGYHTVRNKGDLDSVIKTQTSNLKLFEHALFTTLWTPSLFR